MKAVNRTIVSAILIGELAVGMMSAAHAGDVRDAVFTISTSTAAPSGSAVGGLAVALATKTPVAHVGQPITVTIELRNVGAKTVYFQPADSDHIAFSVQLADNTSLPQRFSLISVPMSMRSGGKPIAPGNSEFHQVSLADMFDLSKPGVYKVSANVPVFYIATQNERTLRSNSISIRILP
jgi:hypothetical protein